MRYLSSLALVASFLVFTGPAQVLTSPAQAEPQSPEGAINALVYAQEPQDPEDGIQAVTSVEGINAQNSDEGIEVLARGPVHEAYAEPVAGAVGAAPIIERQPPPLLEEVPADQKPEGDVQWMPGYWAWDEDRHDFLWVSGFWRLPPPGREWMPGHWAAVEGGWQWVPGFWATRGQEELAYYPPPPEPVDAGPSVPAPAADSTFVHGNWVYQETRYVWRPGFWLGYRPGWIWVPAHYVWTPAGYLYVEGYWDYPLRERGLLFAPVAVDFTLVSRPHWFYRPRYVVNDDCLLGALFVNPVCDHYYFGDYFDAGYRSRGFIGWLDFRFGRDGCDPLYSYYRACYRGDEHWEHGLRDLYAGRFSGSIARPPHTLIQQNTVVQNITNTTINNVMNINNITNVMNIQNVKMLTPLAQVSPAVARLQPVTEPAVAVRSVKERLALGDRRGSIETKLVAQTTGASRATTGSVKTGATLATPVVAKIALPKTSNEKVSTIGSKVSGTASGPAPVAGSHSSNATVPPTSTVGDKPQAKGVDHPVVTKPSTTTTVKPTAVETQPVKKLSTTPTAATVPVAPANTLSRPAVAEPSVSKSVPKPQVPAATKHSSPPRVTHTAEAAAKPLMPAAPKPAMKSQTAPAKPVAPAVARPAPAVPAPKAAAAPKSVLASAPKSAVTAPKPAPAPKPAAKPAAPVSHAAVMRPSAPSPPPKPAAPAPKPQPAPKPAARPQPAPAKPAAPPAPQPPPAKDNSKDRHH